jgi:hypothetical protein
MKSPRDIENTRFAACTNGPRLLSIYSRTARRAPVSKNYLHFYLSAGCFSRDPVQAESHKTGKLNLTRCEIFRGKVPPRTTQN